MTTAAQDAKFIAERYYDRPDLYVREIIQVEPDIWQDDILKTIAREKRISVASGHGIGKTALTAWIIHWFMATRFEPQIVVTANTKSQLDTKTWRELAKWNQRALNGNWFEWSATRFSLKESPATWFAAAIPWSEHNSEAFAGTHEKNVLVLFDEASGIADIIWDVVEGAMTTPGAKWAAFGNPTKNTGRFAACFKRFRHRWYTQQIDSRTAKMADKEQIQQWLDDYGEDSDFARVRIRGMFPRTGDQQFISSETVETATNRDVHVPPGAPKIMGVDVARFGDDQSVVALRHGRRLEKLIKWRELDTMQLAAKVAELIVRAKPDIIFVDGVGIGAGVVDRLQQLNFPVVEVIGGAKAESDGEVTYYNKRAEMWGRAREWLETGSIPDDRELHDDLIGPQYGFDSKMRLQLEKKEDMKKRGLHSPDCGDAFALTFAYPAPSHTSMGIGNLMPEHFYDF